MAVAVNQMLSIDSWYDTCIHSHSTQSAQSTSHVHIESNFIFESFKFDSCPEFWPLVIRTSRRNNNNNCSVHFFPLSTAFTCVLTHIYICTVAWINTIFFLLYFQYQFRFLLRFRFQFDRQQFISTHYQCIIFPSPLCIFVFMSVFCGLRVCVRFFFVHESVSF